MLDCETSKSNSEVSKSNFTSEGAVSQNGLYYQQLPITRYQVRFYANKYFEQFLPIAFAVSTKTYNCHEPLVL